MKLDTLKKNGTAVILAELVNLIAAAVFILTLPEQVPTHFDMNMVCNGYGSRWSGLLLPAGMMLIPVVFLFLYSRTQNQEKNLPVMKLGLFAAATVTIIGTWFILFMMRSDVRPGEQIEKQFWWLFPALYGAVFLILGNYMPKIRQNKVIGYRSPWTLKNAQCWKLTHQFAGKLSVITGLVTLIAAVIIKAVGADGWLPNITVSVVSLLIVVLVPLFYSYYHRAD